MFTPHAQSQCTLDAQHVTVLIGTAQTGIFVYG